MKSQNKNFLYNIVYQLLTFIVPFITVPYVSRVLGAENIGVYSYTYSIVSIFMLFGMLGINNYGSRTIASVRDEKNVLSKSFFSIYFLQLIISFFMMFLYILYLIFFAKDYFLVFLIQSVFMISVMFDINWFFFGIEKFKITITRNFIVKLLSVVLVFIFVKSKNDLYIYTLIMSFATLISQLFLIVLLPKYISYTKVKFKDIFYHLKEVLYLFIPVLSFSIYKIVDKTMIGFLSSVEQVAFYEYAEKLINIPTAIISALGTVMLPHMSYVLNNNKNGYKSIIMDSIKLISKLATIMCLGLILVSNEAILILYGEEFKFSSNILVFLSFTIIASSWANVIRTQYLIPLKKDKVYIFSTVFAAIANIILNVIFIKRYAAIGACLGTVVSEFFVMFYQIFATKKELEHLKYMKCFFIEFFKGLFIIFVSYVCSIFFDNVFIKLSVKIIVAIILFVIINRNFIYYDFLGKKKS